MITKEDIQNLANLARLEMTGEEASAMTAEVDSILGYVGQIQGASADDEKILSKHKNIMREDSITNEAGEYTEKMLANAPARDGNYLKVKNIL